MAIGEVDRLEQRVETFLFAIQDCAEATIWADDVDTRVAELGGDDARLFDRVQIVADLDGPAADSPVGMWLLEMTARVIDHIPVHAVFFSVIGQQSLREISV